MNPQNEKRPVEVFSGTIIEAGMIKNLLESNGILAFLKDQNTGSIAPWYTAPGGFGSVKVVVPASDLGSALQMISEFDENAKSKTYQKP